MTTTGTWYPPPPPQPYHPSAGTGGFLLTSSLTNPPTTMPISDLNPNIAEERQRPRRSSPPLQPRPRPTGTLWPLEVPLTAGRPIRCTIRAASLADAIDIAASRYVMARVDRIRELTAAEARGLGVQR